MKRRSKRYKLILKSSQKGKKIDTKDIFVEDLFSKIRKKEYFSSKFIKKESQKYIFNEVKEIISYKGNLEDSDICFIQKK